MSKNKLDQKNSLTKMVQWSSTPVKTTWIILQDPKYLLYQVEPPQHALDDSYYIGYNH